MIYDFSMNFLLYGTVMSWLIADSVLYFRIIYIQYSNNGATNRVE